MTKAKETAQLFQVGFYEGQRVWWGYRNHQYGDAGTVTSIEQSGQDHWLITVKWDDDKVGRFDSNDGRALLLRADPNDQG